MHLHGLENLRTFTKQLSLILSKAFSLAKQKELQKHQKMSWYWSKCRGKQRNQIRGNVSRRESLFDVPSLLLSLLFSYRGGRAVIVNSFWIYIWTDFVLWYWFLRQEKERGYETWGNWKRYHSMLNNTTKSKAFSQETPNDSMQKGLFSSLFLQVLLPRSLIHSEQNRFLIPLETLLTEGKHVKIFNLCSKTVKHEMMAWRG